MTGDLTVTGNDITFGNGETISNGTNGTVAITAPTTSVSGDLTVGTSLQTATIDFTDGDLAITIADGGAITTSGNATVGGTLGVTGATTLAGTLGVTGVMTSTFVHMATGTVSSEQLTTTDDLTVADDISLTSDSSVVTFGAASEISLVHVENSGLELIKCTDN